MLSASGRPNGVRNDGRASPHLCPLTIVCLKEKGTSLPTLFISAGLPLLAQRSRPESLLPPWQCWKLLSQQAWISPTSPEERAQFSL